MIPALATILGNASQQVALLDSWTNVSTAIGSPGSKSVSSGQNRLLLARTSIRGDPLRTATALSWGGQPMTLVDEESSTDGSDFHTALWRLGESDIVAASGTAFSLTTDNSNAVQFRFQAASYENVDQTSPIVDNFSSQSASGGDDPVASALTTIEGGIVLGTIGINAGTQASVDASFSNLTELLEVVGTVNYNLIGETDSDGNNFTMTLSTTHSTRAHLIGVSLRPA